MAKRKFSIFKFLKRTLVISSILLIVLTALFVNAIIIDQPEPKDITIVSEKRTVLNDTTFQFKNAWARKNKYGFWEAYIEGKPFERGVAYGKLLKEPIKKQEDHFVGQINKLVPNAFWRGFLKYTVAFFNRKLPEHIPSEYQEEIYGVSLSFSDEHDNIGPKYYRILNYHAAHDIGHALKEYNMVGCTSFSANQEYSADSSLIIGRNFDFYMGDEFAEDKVMTVVAPDSGYKFVMYSWGGLMGVVSGMNEKGLTVTINASKSDLPTGAKDPISLLAREILQYSKTIEEASRIAQGREVFVSESILVGSAIDNTSALLEKSPKNYGVYHSDKNYLVCSNHYQSDAYSKDSMNIKNQLQSDSKHRYKRMNDLLLKEPVSVFSAANMLRDLKDTTGSFIGYGNPKSINQFIAHHSIIFKPKELKLWISTSPYQLGEYVCYDFKKIFSNTQPKITDAWSLSEHNIPADPVITTKEFINFQSVFKPIKKQLYDDIMIGLSFDLTSSVEEEFIASNPESYVTYMILGEYYKKHGAIDKAKKNFNLALSKSVASQEERLKIESLLNECDSE